LTPLSDRLSTLQRGPGGPTRDLRAEDRGPMAREHRTPDTHHLPPWLVPPLLPLSWLYGLGLKAYLLPYELGIRRRHRLSCRVVSVGNLTFGGTGKSPAVRAICEKLLERGLRPAVLSRGHGGRLCKVGAIVSDGTKRKLEAADCGDEPAALADALPGTPVAIGKRRDRIGKVLVDRFRPDVVVLDDGMQYWQLHRDVEIVLVDARRPFGTGRLLPAGDLREPIRGVGRADAIVVTGMEDAGDWGPARRFPDIVARAPQAEVFLARRSPRAVVDLQTGERLPPAALARMPVVAVSGIANPASFEAMVAGLGAEIKEAVRFGDHCPYSKGQLDAVEEALRAAGAHAVVTTAKDAAKLHLAGKTYVLDVDLEIENIDRLVDIVVGI